MLVAFDGINMRGADELFFRFDSFPAALISTVELNKTLLPEMPAEALAGRVNIKTYSAMANPGFHGLIDGGYGFVDLGDGPRSEEHKSELQSLMRISYAVFCLKKKINQHE